MTRKKRLREKKNLKRNMRVLKKYITIYHFDIELCEFIRLLIMGIKYDIGIINIDLQINRLKNRRKKIWRKVK